MTLHETCIWLCKTQKQINNNSRRSCAMQMRGRACYNFVLKNHASVNARSLMLYSEIAQKLTDGYCMIVMFVPRTWLSRVFACVIIDPCHATLGFQSTCECRRNLSVQNEWLSALAYKSLKDSLVEIFNYSRETASLFLYHLGHTS